MSDDELDDLDDILDDFQQQQQQQPYADLVTDSPAIDAKHTSSDTVKQMQQQEGERKTGQVDDNDEEFTRQLQAGMQDLLSELQTSPQAKQEFELLVKSMSEATEPATTTTTTTTTTSTTTTAPNTSTSPSSDVQLQETISKTIARMQESSSPGKMNIGADASEDEFLAEMMRQLTAAGGGGGAVPGKGSGNGEDASGTGDFTQMLEGVMSQLMNKEILYEPMKELAQKYPQYIAKTRSSSTDDNIVRYEQQGVVATKITAIFELPNYSDDDPKQKEQVLELMQQDLGSPPDEILGEMAPGMNFGQLPDIGDGAGCVVS